MAKREFAGGWEYLLDDAIFTAPPHPAWSGAALINRDGKLVGVGSLIVGSTTGRIDNTPGNMFVPIDRLTPILADLIADGRPSGAARPWLGITTDELRGRLVVGQVTPGGPAEKAGIVARRPDRRRQRCRRQNARRILPAGLGASGAAGVTVPLDVIQNDEARRVDVSVDEPARSSQAEVDVLTVGITATLAIARSFVEWPGICQLASGLTS